MRSGLRLKRPLVSRGPGVYKNRDGTYQVLSIANGFNVGTYDTKKAAHAAQAEDARAVEVTKIDPDMGAYQSAPGSFTVMWRHVRSFLGRPLLEVGGLPAIVRRSIFVWLLPAIIAFQVAEGAKIRVSGKYVQAPAWVPLATAGLLLSFSSPLLWYPYRFVGAVIGRVIDALRSLVTSILAGVLYLIAAALVISLLALFIGLLFFKN